MYSRPLITVAVPTYNSSDTLRFCIDSILDQSTKLFNIFEFEVIVSDNGSTDNTPEICQGYVKKYGGFFRYYRHTENMGYDKNVASLFSYSHGKFVKILCDDDALSTNALEAHSLVLKEYPEVDLILSNFDVFDKDFENIIHSMSLNRDKDEIFRSATTFFGAAAHRYGQTSSLTFRRDAWNKISCEKAFGTMHIQVYMALHILMAESSSAYILNYPWIKVRAGSPNFSGVPNSQFLIPLKLLKVYEDIFEISSDRIYRDLAAYQRDYTIANMRAYHMHHGLSAEYAILHDELARKVY